MLRKELHAQFATEDLVTSGDTPTDVMRKGAHRDLLNYIESLASGGGDDE